MAPIPTHPPTAAPPRSPWIKRLWGSTLVGVGYLLSPLCWWNDLVINLPLALGFGYLASRPYPEALGVMTGVGYWLTNVVGFVLMQQGAVTALQTDGPGAKRHALRNGLITSTLYTVAIVALLQFHVLETPDFLDSDLMALLNGWWPDWLMG
jgi:hypothetical protein